MDLRISARLRILNFHAPSILLVLALPWFLGCGAGSGSGGAVSLNEAKQITAKFEGSSFVPPPRTVNDVRKLLDENKETNWSAIKDAHVRLEKPPPVTTDPWVLAEYYFQRAQDKVLVSRLNQAQADYKRALKIMRRAGIGESPGRGEDLSQFRILRHMAATMSGLNFKEAIQYMEEAVNWPGLRPGALMSTHSSLAARLTQAGELDKAEIHIDKAKSYFGASYNWNISGAFLRSKTLSIEGKLRTSQGRYALAEEVQRQALRELENWDVDPNSPNYFQTAGIQRVKSESSRRIALARSLKFQGRLAEAEVEIRKALNDNLKTFGRYSVFTAWSLRRLAEILAEQGRYREAEDLARVTVEIYDRIGAAPDSFERAKARQIFGDTLVANREWKGALREFESLKQDFSGEPDLFRRTFVGFNYALALLRTGRTNEAHSLIEPVYEDKRRQLGEKHYDVAELGGMLGMIDLARGRKEDALTYFSQVLPVLVSRSLQSDTEGTSQSGRVQRLQQILESYIELLSDIRGSALEREAGINAVDEAFQLADLAQGKSVQRALTASAARAAAQDPELADLVRREQDTQKQISALYGLLANVSSQSKEGQDSKVIQSLQEKIKPLTAAHARFTKEITRRFPSYAVLIDPTPPTIEQVRAVLRPGEALITSYVSEEQTYVWAIPHQGKVAFTRVGLGRSELEARVKELRQALTPNASTLGDIPPFNVALAHRLYQALLEPVKVGWRRAKSLLVVSHGPLGHIPFSLLATEPLKLNPEKEPLFSRYRTVPWLIRQVSVTVLPSVTSLSTLRFLPPGDPNRRRFVGFGDPYFNERQANEAAKPAVDGKKVASRATGLLDTRGLEVRLRSSPAVEGMDSRIVSQLPRLSDTYDEVRSIAMAMNADLTTDVFTGARANEQVVKTMDMSGRQVIVFATHGLVPGHVNGLTQPALALSSPKVAGVEGDGLLTMEEILKLKLDADWVVLSACDTASGRGAGAEAVSGLGRAFFYAGARALLVSSWPVETTSAKALTTDLFRRQATEQGLSRAEALRQTMLALIDGPGRIGDDGRTVFSYAHPLFWAPFILVGDGGK